MAVTTCKTCGQMRAKNGERECPVCWLIRELKREHTAGEHEVMNASCIACTRGRNPLPVIGRYVPPTRRYVKPGDVLPTPADVVIPRQPKPKLKKHVKAHDKCDHEKTPQARKKCRAERAGLVQ